MQPIDGSEESKITIKEGKTDFDMSHLLPLSRWATTAQPVREEFSDSESEDSDSEESTDGLHHPIPRRRKKVSAKKSAINSKLKFQKIPKRKNKESRKRKAPPPPPRAAPPQPKPKKQRKKKKGPPPPPPPPKRKAPPKPRVRPPKPSLIPSKQI